MSLSGFKLLPEEAVHIVAQFSLSHGVHGVKLDARVRWVVVVFHEAVDEGGEVPIARTVVGIFIVNDMDHWSIFVFNQYIPLLNIIMTHHKLLVMEIRQ